ncbi:MAG TPA: flagellar basal body rod protein FlgC [Myxococcota bacterium]
MPADFFHVLHVSADGLAAERMRVDLSAQNLANAETTRTPGGGPYKRLDPVFAATVDEAGSTTVKVAEVKEDQSAPKKVYLPGHPDADADGFVTLPNVDPVNEVVNLLSAQRGYEANTTAIDTTKTMAQRALEIMK